jgi:succinylglutamate desuccinylase
VAGLHGNEPAGVQAVLRVLNALDDRKELLTGEIVALSGNRAALALGRRYLSRDLNRAWTSDLARGVSAFEEDVAEDREQVELLEAIETTLNQTRGPVFLMDLHTTSGPGEPFSTIMDSLSSRRFALSIPVPLIVGLGELVEGTLLGFLAERGIPGLVFEGGQRSDEASVGTTEAGIWLAMAGAGVLREAMFPEVDRSRKSLTSATRDLPAVLELKHRHAITEADGFEMLPSFRSFQPVQEGQVLARDRRGEVRAPEGGRLLMPLYQSQGEDGFFLVREFLPFWLTLSEVLRRMKAGRFLHWLPGIRRDPKDPDTLVVDRGVARWYALEIVHLLGFRRTVEDGEFLVVTRQREASF